MKMENKNIEVQVEQKSLSVNKRKLNLEDNFEGAGVFIVGNKKDETILELNYRKKGDFSPDNEGKRVYKFLQDLKIKSLDVYSNREQDYERDVFPAVIITGRFNAIVYR